MRWLLTLVLSAMHIMREKNRCDMMFEIGERFNALSKEVFADKILPLLVAVCPLIGRDIAIYTLSLEKAVRDKNAALEDLERLRTRVQKKLGLLAANAMGGAGRLVRKKPRRFLAEGASQAGSEANTGFDAASEASSMQSSMSSATTGSRRRKKKEPLNVAVSPGACCDRCSLITTRTNSAAAILMDTAPPAGQGTLLVGVPAHGPLLL